MTKVPGNEEFTAFLKSVRLGCQAPFDGVIKLICKDRGDEWPDVLIDGRKTPVTVITANTDNVKADCTLRGSEETMLRLLSGERGVNRAYISGRLAISGDMSVMARIELSPP